MEYQNSGPSGTLRGNVYTYAVVDRANSRIFFLFTIFTRCAHLKLSYGTKVSCGAVYCAVQGGSGFSSCE